MVRAALLEGHVVPEHQGDLAAVKVDSVVRQPVVKVVPPAVLVQKAKATLRRKRAASSPSFRRVNVRSGMPEGIPLFFAG